MEQRAHVRYSEAFKIEVVTAIESGKFKSLHAAAQAYGVGAMTTVAGWVRRYGKSHLLRKVVYVMQADEQTEAQKLRKRVRELEHALSDAHIDLALESEYVKLACRAAGIKDVEAFKKNTMGRGERGC